jgi:hypothetical protein
VVWGYFLVFLVIPTCGGVAWWGFQGFWGGVFGCKWEKVCVLSVGELGKVGKGGVI